MPRVLPTANVREAILDAAMRMLEQQGYKKMTMDDLADQVHIGKATIYGYFDSKQHVALSVIERCHERLMTEWRALSGAALPASARLIAMLRLNLLTSFETASRYRSSMDEMLMDLRKPLMIRREHYAHEQISLLAQVLHDGQTSGEFTFDDVHHTSRAVLDCIRGLFPSNLTGRELGERAEVEARVESVVELILNGLRPHCPGKPH